MKERAAEFGMTGEMLAKNDMVLKGGFDALEICKRPASRSPMAATCWARCRTSRPRVHHPRRGGPADRDHPLGHHDRRRGRAPGGQARVVEPGAFADLLLVDGDPLKNLGLFKDQGKHLSAIMKGGSFHKNRLN